MTAQTSNPQLISELPESFTEKVWQAIASEEYGISRGKLADKLGLHFDNPNLSAALANLTAAFRVQRLGFRYAKFEPKPVSQWPSGVFLSYACREGHHRRCPSIRCQCPCHNEGASPP